MENIDFNQEEFDAFWDKIEKNDEKSWYKLNFVLKRSIQRFLMKKGVPEEDRDDIFQEVITLFYEKIVTNQQNNRRSLKFENFAKLKSYNISIADKKLKEYFRKKKKGYRLISLDYFQEKKYLQKSTQFKVEEKQGSELTLEIKKGFALLPLIDQKILHFTSHGYTSKDAAEELGITAGNARARKRRALIKLKDLLGKLEKEI